MQLARVLPSTPTVLPVTACRQRPSPTHANWPQAEPIATRSYELPRGFAAIAATGKAYRRIATEATQTSQVQALLLAFSGVWKQLTQTQLIAYSRGQML